jgi:hypothetical protein
VLEEKIQENQPLVGINTALNAIENIAYDPHQGAS